MKKKEVENEVETKEEIKEVKLVFILIGYQLRLNY